MDLRERLMDRIGVLDTDPALVVFAKFLRDQAQAYAGSMDAHIGITLNNMADEIDPNAVDDEQDEDEYKN